MDRDGGYGAAMGGATANFPMALDETHHRLFALFFENPRKLSVFDRIGKVVIRLDSPGERDDIFMMYKAANLHFRLEGFIGIIQQQDADHYKSLTKIPTPSGAAHVVVPELGCSHLAVPHRGTQRAEVRVYEAQPTTVAGLTGCSREPGHQQSPLSCFPAAA